MHDAHTVGQPLPQAEVKLVNPCTGETVASDEIGSSASAAIW